MDVENCNIGYALLFEDTGHSGASFFFKNL